MINIQVDKAVIAPYLAIAGKNLFEVRLQFTAEGLYFAGYGNNIMISFTLPKDKFLKYEITDTTQDFPLLADICLADLNKMIKKLKGEISFDVGFNCLIISDRLKQYSLNHTLIMEPMDCINERIWTYKDTIVEMSLIDFNEIVQAALITGDAIRFEVRETTLKVIDDSFKFQGMVETCVIHGDKTTDSSYYSTLYLKVMNDLNSALKGIQCKLHFCAESPLWINAGPVDMFFPPRVIDEDDGMYSDD